MAERSIQRSAMCRKEIPGRMRRIWLTNTKIPGRIIFVLEYFTWQFFIQRVLPDTLVCKSLSSLLRATARVVLFVCFQDTGSRAEVRRDRLVDRWANLSPDSDRERSNSDFSPERSPRLVPRGQRRDSNQGQSN